MCLSSVIRPELYLVQRQISLQICHNVHHQAANHCLQTPVPANQHYKNNGP